MTKMAKTTKNTLFAIDIFRLADISVSCEIINRLNLKVVKIMVLFKEFGRLEN
jgi:hypothetical protein